MWIDLVDGHSASPTEYFHIVPEHSDFDSVTRRNLGHLVGCYEQNTISLDFEAGWLRQRFTAAFLGQGAMW